MEKSELYDKIDRWLQGKMPPDEAVTFEAAMQADPALAEEVAVQREVLAAMNLLVEKDLRVKMQVLEAQWRQSPEGREHLAAGEAGSGEEKHAGRNWWLLLLLLVVLGAGYAAFLRLKKRVAPPVHAEIQQAPPVAGDTAPGAISKDTASPENPPVAPPETPSTNPQSPPVHSPGVNYIALAESFAPAPNLGDIALKNGNGSSSEPLNDFNRAKKAFSEKDFQRVLALLKNPESAWATDALWLRGHAYFKLRQFKKAAGEFNYLILQKSLRHGDEAAWMLSLSELAQHPAKERQVKTHLKAIADDPEHPWHARALDLQKALQR